MNRHVMESKVQHRPVTVPKPGLDGALLCKLKISVI